MQDLDETNRGKVPEPSDVLLELITASGEILIQKIL